MALTLAAHVIAGHGSKEWQRIGKQRQRRQLLYGKR